MPVKKSQVRAIKKWQSENYFKGAFYFPKQLEPIIKEKARFYGSVNAYLRFLVEADVSDYSEPVNVPFEDAP